MSEGGLIPIKGPDDTESTDLDRVAILPRKTAPRSGVPIPDTSGGELPSRTWDRIFLELTGQLR